MRRNAARFLLGIIVANCVCCLHVFADNSAPDSVATGEWSNKYFVDFDNDWSKPVDSDTNATKSNTKLITTVEGARDTTTGAGYVKRAGLGIGDGLTVSNGQLLIDTSAIGDSIGGNAVTYTPGNNVQISTNNEISATDTKYQSGNATSVTNNGPIDVQNNASKGVKVESNKLIVGIDNETIKFDSNGNLTAVCPDNSGTGCAVCEVCEECEQCQTCQECTEYTAGENVQISATGEISATDTKYQSGNATSVTDNGPINVLIDGQTIKTNSAGKLYAAGGAELYKAGTNITIDSNYRISTPTIAVRNGLQLNGNNINVGYRQNSGIAYDSAQNQIYIGVDGETITYDENGNLTVVGCNNNNDDITISEKTNQITTNSTTGTWSCTFSYGTISGITSCNETVGNNAWNQNGANYKDTSYASPDLMNQSTTGTQCWVKLTAFPGYDVTYAPYVYEGTHNCNSCKIIMYQHCLGYQYFRRALYYLSGIQISGN